MLPELLPDEPAKDPTIPPLYDPQPAPVTSEVAGQRALKAQFGSGHLMNGTDHNTLQHGIMSGNEESFRRLTRINQDMELERAKTRMLQEYMDEKEGPVTQFEMDYIMGLTSNMGKRPVHGDPDTIWEENYAEQFMQRSLTNNENSSLEQAMAEDPEAANEIVDRGKWHVATKESLQHILEGLEADYNSKGFMRKLEENIENYVPYVSWSNTNNPLRSIPNPSSAFLPGNNMAETIEYIWLQPYSKRVQLFKEVAANIAESNILDAQRFISAAMGYGNQDAALDNVFGSLDIIDTASIGVVPLLKGAARKLARKSLKGTRDIDPQRSDMTRETVTLEDGSTVIVEESGPNPTAAAIIRESLGPRVDESKLAAKKTLDIQGILDLDDTEIKKLPTSLQEDIKTLRELDKKYLATDSEEFTEEVQDGIERLEEKIEDTYNDIIIGERQDAKYKEQVAAEKVTPAEEMTPAVEQLAETAQQAVKAQGGRQIDAVEVAAAVGDSSQAAGLGALKTWMQKWFAKDPYFQGRTLLKTATSISDPESYFRGASRLVEAQKREILNYLGRNSAKLLEAMSSSGMVNRLTEAALRVAIEEAQAYLRRMNTHLQDAVLDVVHIPRANMTNTQAVEMHLGTRDKNFFENVTQAARVAKEDYKLGKFIIRKQGDGAYIVVLTKDLDEVTAKVRDQMATDNVTAQGFANTFIGFLRTPTDTLSKLNVENRGIVTHAPSEMMRLVGEVAQEINGLKGVFSAKKLKRLEKVIKVGRDLKHEIVDENGEILEVRGKYFETEGEFSDVYKRENGSYPDQQDIVAYYTYVQLNDFDYMVRNLGLYRDKSRLGIRRIRFLYKKPSEADIVPASASATASAGAQGIIGFSRQKKLNPKVMFGRKSNLENTRGSPVMGETGAEYGKIIDKATGEREDAIAAYNAAHPDRALNPDGSPVNLRPDVDPRLGEPVKGPSQETSTPTNAEPVDVGERIWTQAFDGKVMDDVPWNDGNDGGIAIQYPDGQTAYYRKHEASTGDSRAVIDDLISKGYKVIQVANPTAYELSLPFQSDDVINFILVKEFKESPMDWKQINRRGGGHVVYKEERYVKQAQITATSYGSHRLDGDTAVLAITSDAEGKMWAKRLETARQMIINNDPNTRAYIRDNLPWKVDDFLNFFKPDKNGKSKLSLNEPFTLVKAGEGVNDRLKDELRKRYSNFEDLIDSPYNLYRDINKKFTGEREANLPTVARSGTEANPLWKLEEPRLVDPMQAMQDSMANLIRSRFYDDYKFFAVESFMQEFGDIMKDPLAHLRSNPLDVLHRPEYSNTADPAKKAAAETSRMALIHLLGTPSKVQERFDWLRHKLIDYAFNSGGAKRADWVADMDLVWQKDPLSFARNVAFHMKLGLFNPVQMFLQAQTWFHVAAISPQHVGAASSAAFLMRRMGISNVEEVHKYFGKLSKAWGWNEADFAESFRALKDSGFYLVGGDVAVRDQMLPKVMRSHMGRFLEAGTFFFTEAERMVRLTAWNVAYREFKLANPGKTLGARETNSILRRAKDLSVNMTRDSNASWQQGIFSLPTQFLSYQARLAEQFMGKRLTRAEKARAMTMYSAIYGVPTAMGAGIGVWPIGEEIKQGLMERGIQIDDNALEAVLDGIPAMMLEYLTGEDFNIAERYGPGGLSIFKEIMNGEKEIAEIVFGASGSILGDTINSTNPLLKTVMNVFSSDENDYPLLMEDFIDVTRNISTANNAIKMIYAMNIGKYISKNEVSLSDVSTIDTLFMGITGLTPAELTDTFTMIESGNELQDAQNFAKKEIVKNIRRALQAQSEGDMALAQKYYKAAKINVVGGDFLPTQYPDLLLESTRGQLPLTNKIRPEFYVLEPPRSQQAQRLKEFQRQAQEELQ